MAMSLKFIDINRKIMCRNDSFHWIPQGLFYDMTDVRNETGNPIIDGVSG